MFRKIKLSYQLSYHMVMSLFLIPFGKDEEKFNNHIIAIQRILDEIEEEKK